MFKVVGSPASWVLSREDKLQDRDTVLYEIDMLRFTHDRMHRLLGGAQKGQETRRT